MEFMSDFSSCKLLTNLLFQGLVFSKSLDHRMLSFFKTRLHKLNFFKNRSHKAFTYMVLVFKPDTGWSLSIYHIVHISFSGSTLNSAYFTDRNFLTLLTLKTYGNTCRKLQITKILSLTLPVYSKLLILIRVSRWSTWYYIVHIFRTLTI